MRKLLLALCATLATSASAIPPVPEANPPAPPPKLLIVISVDQFAADLFDEYRPQFTGGLARLARGTAFRNGYQGHAATETCPGHSGILTGTYPATNGIISNQWYDLAAARQDKAIYCAEDESVPGTTSTRYQASPVHLKAPTLGDLLKARSPKSLNVAVAGKDRAAMMMGGHKVDQRWYFTGRAFATDVNTAKVPQSVVAANAAVAAALAKPQPGLEPPPACVAKAQPIALSSGRTVGNGRFERAAGDDADFRSSPEYDGAVLALGAALIGELKLGQDNAPDILSLGLSATDYVGHRYGPGGQEMCLQLLSLDRDLGDFFRLLDSAGVDYAVALTADHGVVDIPERLKLRGMPQADRVDKRLAAGQVGKVVGLKLNLAGPVLFGGTFGDVYIDRALSRTQRAKVREEAMAIYRAHPQVEAVYSADQLRRTPLPTTTPDRWTLIERARASFDPARSGDFVVLLKRYITSISVPGDAIAMHGSVWDYDRRVPILFWRRGMPERPNEQSIAVADIMPTLAAMLSLPIDSRKIDGKCLLGIEGIACPPR